MKFLCPECWPGFRLKQRAESKSPQGREPERGFEIKHALSGIHFSEGSQEKETAVRDFVVSLIFIAVSVFVFFASDAFSVQENAFSLAHNPAFYPRLIACILFLLSFVLLEQAVRKGAFKNTGVKLDRKKLLKAGKLFLVVLVYIILLTLSGYIPSSLMCIFLSVYVFGGSFKQAVLYSVIITVSLFLVFQLGFRIPLPEGEIFEYWR